MNTSCQKRFYCIWADDAFEFLTLFGSFTNERLENPNTTNTRNVIG